MTIDHYFSIGKPHLAQGSPCEDYAWSTTLQDGLQLGVVADGCSGALANTDIGARALAFAFEKAVKARQSKLLGWFDDAFYADLRAIFAAHRITDDPLDYYATVMGLVATATSAEVFLFGDGVLAVAFADGSYQVTEFEWHGNAPYYLAYTLDERARQAFIEQLGSTADKAVLRRTTQFRLAGDASLVMAAQEDWLPFSEFEYGYRMQLSPAAQAIQAIAVFSDGVARVGSAGALLPITQAVTQFMAFKNFRGGFVKRRMLKALAQYQTLGMTPLDDLAVACAWFGGE